jgi:hypothetical protein
MTAGQVKRGTWYGMKSWSFISAATPMPVSFTKNTTSAPTPPGASSVSKSTLQAEVQLAVWVILSLLCQLAALVTRRMTSFMITSTREPTGLVVIQ